YFSIRSGRIPSEANNTALLESGAFGAAVRAALEPASTSSDTDTRPKSKGAMCQRRRLICDPPSIDTLPTSDPITRVRKAQTAPSEGRLLCPAHPDAAEGRKAFEDETWRVRIARIGARDADAAGDRADVRLDAPLGRDSK